MAKMISWSLTLLKKVAGGADMVKMVAWSMMLLKKLAGGDDMVEIEETGGGATWLPC